MLRFLPLILAGCCGAQPTSGPIAAIEFYGSAAVDFTRLRTVFPVRVGDIFELKNATIQDQSPDSQEFREVINKNGISVAPVFVPDLRGWVFYVDVEPPDTSPTVWNPRPTGTDRLPARIVRLYEHAISRYVNGGIFAGDESTNGYSLSKDPIMRKDELQLIKYARAHARRVYSVLKRSASDRERIAAAWIAGYAHQGSDQLSALLHAVMDPDATVRNNAIRVLALLASHDAGIARRIPPDPLSSWAESLKYPRRVCRVFYRTATPMRSWISCGISSGEIGDGLRKRLRNPP